MNAVEILVYNRNLYQRQGPLRLFQRGLINSGQTT